MAEVAAFSMKAALTPRGSRGRRPAFANWLQRRERAAACFCGVELRFASRQGWSIPLGGGGGWQASGGCGLLEERLVCYHRFVLKWLNFVCVSRDGSQVCLCSGRLEHGFRDGLQLVFWVGVQLSQLTERNKLVTSPLCV